MASQGSSWEDLSGELKRLNHANKPITAEWSAVQGNEDRGIWLLRPSGPENEQARAEFSLIATRAIAKIGFQPIPLRKPLQYDPLSALYFEVEQEAARLRGENIDLSAAVPHGFGVGGEGGVDPCTRAWLELLRTKSPTFRSASGKLSINGGVETVTLSGRIRNLFGASATYCTLRARDEIAMRLNTLMRPTSADVPLAPHPRNRLIRWHFASDRVADVQLPQMQYEFPPVFPHASRAKVMAARLLAEEALTKKKASIHEFSQAEALLLDLVAQVFVAFSEEACNLGLQSAMTAGDVEIECLRFLRNCVFEAGLMDNSVLVPEQKMPRDISDELRGKIERFAEWKRYRLLLQDVAMAQSGIVPGHTDTTRKIQVTEAVGRPLQEITSGPIVPELQVGDDFKDDVDEVGLTPPRRMPNLQSSRERLELLAVLSRELATIKQDLRRYCSGDDLKRKYPDFILWKQVN